MTWKRCLLFAGLTVALLAAVAVGIRLSLGSAPEFYEQALELEHHDPVQRRREAEEFVHRTLALATEIRYSESWSEEFTEEQVNAWLAEELQQRHRDWLPAGVTEPRLHFGDGVLQLAFRYEHNGWPTVVSCVLRPWLVRPNELAIEVQSITAGWLPLPTAEALKDLPRHLFLEDWRIQWRESSGHDVIVVQLNQERPRPPILEYLMLQKGVLQVAGSRATRAKPEPVASLTTNPLL